MFRCSGCRGRLANGASSQRRRRGARGARHAVADVARLSLQAACGAPSGVQDESFAGQEEKEEFSMLLDTVPVALAQPLAMWIPRCLQQRVADVFFVARRMGL